MELRRAAGADKAFPIVVTLDGTRSQIDTKMPAQSMFTHYGLELKERGGDGGWGKVELPADENSRDNAGYFVYGRDAELRTAIVSDGGQASRYLRLAAAPAPELLRQSSEVIPAVDVARLDWTQVACVIWQAGRPSPGTVSAVERFVREGGTLLMLPTSRGQGMLGIDWGQVETADAERPYRIGVWNEYDGPLARTAQGQDLPVAGVTCTRRRIPVPAASDDKAATEAPDGERETWHDVASFVDGKPFLMRRLFGMGRAYACTTLPETAWSSLGKDWILVPLVQRIIAEGANRLWSQESALCGEWAPEDDQTWTAVDVETYKDPRWQSGIYRSGTRLVALNRPAAEDLPEVLATEEAAELFGALPVQIAARLERSRKSSLQSEIWRQFIYLALLCMVGESMLLLGERVKPKRHE